ncbi:MAG: PEP-CTERM sorting domain-containing protein [Vicinamibacterales bacterium]
MSLRSLLSTCALLVLLPTLVAAAPILPTSYDMPNGHGQASGGTFNYWDLSYSGVGSTNVDGAPLSGGHGDLTDGIVAGDIWFNVENAAGTGPYVGWRNIDPRIDFHFASVVEFLSVRIHLDDANGFGSVNLPTAVRFTAGAATTTINVVDPAGSAPLWVNFDLAGLGFAGSALSVELLRKNQWVFASEFEFDGRAVPEPSMLLLAALGLGAGARRVRRRPQGAPAP